MKKILATATLITAIFTGCLKDDTINVVGLNNTGTLVEIIPYNDATIGYSGGGLENFTKSAVITSGQTAPITLFFVVNIAATGGTPLNKDLTVTVAYDDAARTAYNSQGGDQYLQMPDSCYSLPIKTGTIKAGKYLDTFYVTFYPTKIDPSKNYMAAISLKDAQGQTISGNFSTVYFHTIGNPIAGPVTREWIRYNTATQTGTPAFDQIASTLFSPVSPTTIRVSSGTGVAYLLSFTNTGGVLSNFNVAFPTDANDNGSAAYNGITITSGPTIIKADPINGKYEFNFVYLNSSNAARNITDKFNK
jgi:hypothetical protein